MISDFDSSGIQKVRTEEAAANMILLGAHFKHDTTPMLLSHDPTCLLKYKETVSWWMYKTSVCPMN